VEVTDLYRFLIGKIYSQPTNQSQSQACLRPIFVI
jgi:hypothetical protein